jgi:adenylate cyclase
MTQQSVTPSLVAILAADAVGYSRLMEADENGTIQMLETCRRSVDGLVASHHGRVFGSAGDSVIAEFTSPVEAVGCAADIQEALERRNADLPEDRRMRFRIGVNLGDVVVKGDNLLGDGVNIAARLQVLADPGGIFLSGTMSDQVDGKLDLEFDDLGDREVKNIAKPVHVYRVRVDRTEMSRDSQDTPASRSLPFPDKPSIAVLPFDNMSGDPEQEYFSDGITEDLIPALSNIRWFFVIARNSSFSYKGRAVDVTRVGKELGVRYVLEGSVRRSGDRIRITAQLIEATTDNHVWAERYDRNFDDIFDLQDEMRETIVGAIESELGAAERARAARKPPERLDAWDACQRGLWHMWQFGAEDNRKARQLFE